MLPDILTRERLHKPLPTRCSAGELLQTATDHLRPLTRSRRHTAGSGVIAQKSNHGHFQYAANIQQRQLFMKTQTLLYDKSVTHCWC